MEKRRDFERFTGAFVAAAIALSYDYDPRAIAIYFRLLAEYELADVMAAFEKATKTRKWFPKPVELIEMLDPQKELPEGHTATSEAMFVLDAIQKYGGYEVPLFRDKATWHVIRERFGGWSNLCATLRDDQRHWFIKNFTAAYENIQSRGDNTTALSVVRGGGGLERVKFAQELVKNHN